MLILKGFIIGIGKIIPGVSGSLLAISLGVYERAIEALIHLKDNFKKNIFYLEWLCLGILIGIIGFSNIIVFFLNNYYLYTMVFFIGLMMGNIPSSLKIIKNTKKRNYIYFVISILLLYIIYQFKFEVPFTPNNNIKDSFIVFILGGLDALTMIVPGISGTALFMMLNCYSFIMNLFSNLLSQIYFVIIFGLGAIFGIVLTSILMNFMFKNYKDVIHLIILGFTITSLAVLFKQLIKLINIYNLIPIFILLLLGFFISKKLEKLS